MKSIFEILGGYAVPPNQDHKRAKNKVVIYASNACIWNDSYRWSGLALYSV